MWLINCFQWDISVWLISSSKDHVIFLNWIIRVIHKFTQHFEWLKLGAAQLYNIQRHSKPTHAFTHKTIFHLLKYNYITQYKRHNMAHETSCRHLESHSMQNKLKEKNYRFSKAVISFIIYHVTPASCTCTPRCVRSIDRLYQPNSEAMGTP